MSHEIESIAYAGKTPWHGLGVEVEPTLTPQEILMAADLDWGVRKDQILVKHPDGIVKPIPGKMALVRDRDDRVLSVVGSSYKPVQNSDAFSFFHQFVEAGNMEMHTAGSLWGGKYVWALAKMNKGFTIGKEDAVESFLLLMSPHIFGKALVMQFTPIRVVCWNTLNFALGESLKGSSGAVRVPHCTAFDAGVKEQAATALGLAIAQTKEMQQASTLLSKKKASEAQVEEFFCKVLQFDPKDAQRKKDGSIRQPRQLPMFREALERAPGQDMTSARGTWWGAVNAVTYVADHVNGRDRDTSLKNAWVGHQSTIKRRAFAEALKMAA